MSTETITGTGVFDAFITNLGKYNEGELIGEWVGFPTTPEEMQDVFRRIGIGQKDEFGQPYEEWFITDYDCPIPGLYDCLGENESLDELNYLANKIEEISVSEQECFEAAVELGEYTDSVQDLINLTENLDCYELYSDIHSDSDLGYYYAEDSGIYDTGAMGALSNYIDYEGFGRDIRFEEGGTFTDHGYIVGNQDRFIEQYNGDREEIPDEYRVLASMDMDEQELDEPEGLSAPKQLINLEKPSIRKQLAENKEKTAEPKPIKREDISL